MALFDTFKVREVAVTKMSQKFYIILVTWGTIQQVWMLLQRSCRWQTILDCEMASSPDILWVIFTRFTTMARNTALESTFFGLPDLVWSSTFFQPKQNFFNRLVTVLKSTAHLPFIQQMLFGGFCSIMSKLIKHKVLNQTTLHIHLWGFQIIRRVKQCTCHHTDYHNTNQSRNLSIVQTDLVTWYTCYKLAHTKILQNF